MTVFDSKVDMTQPPRNELRLVLLGKTGSGKSKTGNIILGRREFDSACSSKSVTETCKLGHAKRLGKTLNIVDTPGVFDTRKDNEKTQNEIKKCVWFTTPGPHAILLCVPIARFTEEDVTTFKHFVSHFGESLMKYVIILFTRLDDLKRDQKEKNLEGTGLNEYVQTLAECPTEFLQKCNNRYIAFDNFLEGKAADNQVEELITIIEKMVIENGGSHYTNEDYEKAERILQEKIAEEKKQKEREMLELQHRIKKETDIELRKEYDRREKQLRDQIDNIRYITVNPGGGCTIL